MSKTVRSLIGLFVEIRIIHLEVVYVAVRKSYFSFFCSYLIGWRGELLVARETRERISNIRNHSFGFNKPYQNRWTALMKSFCVSYHQLAAAGNTHAVAKY